MYRSPFSSSFEPLRVMYEFRARLARMGCSKVFKISGVSGGALGEKSEPMIGLMDSSGPFPQDGMGNDQPLPPGRAVATETSASSESFETDMTITAFY